MDVSDKRDNYIRQFQANPFSPNNLKEIFKDIFKDIDKNISFEIFKFDSKKHIVEFSFDCLELFRIASDGEVSILSKKSKLLKDEILLCLPKSVFSESDLDFVNIKDSVDEIREQIKGKYLEILDGEEGELDQFPAFMILKQN